MLEGLPRPRSERSDLLRVLVVDDHRAFAEALGARLGGYPQFGTVRLAFTPCQAATLVDAHAPDLVLLDLRLGEADGLETLQELLRRRPGVAVLMVSGVEDIDTIVRAMSEGALGWVPKDASIEELLEAVEETTHGRLWLPRSLVAPVLRELLRRPAPRRAPASFVDELTPRQVEVLRCLADGMNRGQIAERFGLSPHTVRTHIQEILRKAGVHSTLAALAKAREVQSVTL